jgi:tetraacyldisaccharide 4'-kinase
VAWADRIEAGLGRLWWRHEPSLATTCLRPLAWGYGAVSGLRRLAFESGWHAARRAPVPVLVVGNLVAGGAGKTPTVIALVDALRRGGWSPGVISRGHGRDGTHAAPVDDDSRAVDVGDEPLLIRRRTRAPVWVARQRIEAALGLCAAHADVDVLVADDGLQHVALARDVQVMVFDERGIGNGLLLPAGPMRQPMPRHVPVNTHVLYNAPRASTALPGAIARRALGGAVALQHWWQGAAATLEMLHALRGRPLLAVAGMAVPRRFFDMLRDEGLQVRGLALPDHFAFDTVPWPADAGDVLLTEKDAVKLPRHAAGGPRIWVVTLDFQLPAEFIAAVLHNLRLSPRP